MSARGTLAPLVSVVSASGGVGKSAVSAVAAHLAARFGLKTGLVEADLQFGDMGFWFGLDDELPTLALGAGCKPLALAHGLNLYKAPCFPELAEEIYEDVARFVAQVRSEHDLVIADTGAFWSGLTAELLVSSDSYWMLCDQRPASVAGAVRASELCGRIGVADTRRVCVYNRWSSKARMSASEVARALDTNVVHCVPDGKAIVDELLCAGDIEELMELESPLVSGVDALLRATLPRVGCAYRGLSNDERPVRLGGARISTVVHATPIFSKRRRGGSAR